MSQHDIRTDAAAAPHAVATDPVCSMTVDPHSAKHRGEHGGRTYYFCSPGCKTKFLANPRALPGRNRSREGRRNGAGGNRLHLPHASGDPADRTWLVSDLRHGSGTRDGRRRDAAQSGTGRHVAAVVDRPGSGPAGRGARDGRPSHRAAPAREPAGIELAAASVCHPGGLVGGLAVLRARLAIAGHAAPQHVHPDRLGHRRRLGLQRCSHRRPADFPAGVSGCRSIGCRLLRGRRRHHRARPAGPGAGVAGSRAVPRGPSAHCSTWRRRPPAGSAAMAATRKSVSTSWRSAISSGSGPARKCRSTAR